MWNTVWNVIFKMYNWCLRVFYRPSFYQGGCEFTGKVTPTVNDVLIACTCASKSNYTAHSIGMNATRLFVYKPVCSRLAVAWNYHQPLGGANRKVAATANSMAGVGISGLYVVPKIVCHGLWGSYWLLLPVVTKCKQLGVSFLLPGNKIEVKCRAHADRTG